MNAAWGAGLLAATVLLFAWTYGQYRQPKPKAWTESETLTVILTLFMIGLFSFSLALLGRSIATLQTETLGLEIVAVAAAGAVLCWVLVPRLIAPAGQAPQTDAEMAIPDPANDPHPRSPANLGRAARKSGRRRAA